MKLIAECVVCFLLLTAIWAQTTNSPTCTVEGQITQQGGAPIRKAHVELSPVENTHEGSDYKTLSDANGRFCLEDVKPGNYRIDFGHPGFVDLEKRHHGSGRLLSLGPGQVVKDLLFDLTAASVIAGKVLDAEGDPIPNIQVLAIKAGAHGHSRYRDDDNAGECSTNDLGECRISDLGPGKYLIAANSGKLSGAEPFNSTAKKLAFAETYFPGTTDRDMATLIDVHAGDEVPVTVSLAAVPTYHVRGSIKGLPSWVATKGAVLFMQPENSVNEFRFKTADLDKNGHFDFGGVLPGNYQVFLVPRSVGLGQGEPSGPQVMTTGQVITVDAGDVEGLQLTPTANGFIQARLRMDNGQKIDWTQLTVYLYTDESLDNSRIFSFGSGPQPDRVKNNGSFETVALPGTYHVWMFSSNDNLRDYFVKAVNLAGNDVSDSGLSVAGGSMRIEIVLSANGATIEGFVGTEKGQPAADVHVICVPDPSRRKRRDLYQDVQTDIKGHFSLQGLNPGEYTIFALDDDINGFEGIMDPQFISAHANSSEHVKIEEGGHKTITLKLSGYDE